MNTLPEDSRPEDITVSMAIAGIVLAFALLATIVRLAGVY